MISNILHNLFMRKYNHDRLIISALHMRIHHLRQRSMTYYKLAMKFKDQEW